VLQQASNHILMSAHRRVVRLTPRATRDLDDILVYTELMWGPDQADDYDSSINQAFDRLRAHPYVGPNHDDRSLALRKLEVEHHIIYYRVQVDEIEVVRILHERADPTRHL
jgi:toxin ParE1/3/4